MSVVTVAIATVAMSIVAVASTSAAVAVSLPDKLEELIDKFHMTFVELGIGAGCGARAVEVRRKKLQQPESGELDKLLPKRKSKIDRGIEYIHSTATMMTERYSVDPDNVRAWLIGLSPHLEEQRPLALLGEGMFEIVREAAIAYAVSESPKEFLERLGPVPRVPEPSIV
ncbi:MAG TPA: hypothetical protein VGF95_10395 [Solirubrobacteraceae bacterium]